MTPAASPLVSLGIAAISLVAFLLVALALSRLPDDGPRLARRFVAGAGLWLAASGIAAASGFFARFDAVPPRMIFLFVPMVALPVWLALSRTGKRLAEHTPLALLVGFHAFRLPLELVMHEAAREGVMPVQMTFTGWNFDIVTGASAILVAGLAAKGRAPRGVVLAWNVLGSVLLLAIAAIAVASLPAFHAFGSEPRRVNTWVSYFPYVWLPAALVSSALFGHIVLYRRLLGALSTTPPSPAPTPAIP